VDPLFSEAPYMKVSRVALAAMLAFGGVAAAGTVVLAQQPPVAARSLNLTRDERNALTALQTAVAGQDRAAQDSALAAARAVARGADAQYGVAHLQFEIGRARGDQAMQTQAIDAMVASGSAPPEELASLLSNQAGRAFSASDFQRADRLLARVLELTPNDPTFLASYGQFKARIGDRPAAVTLLQRALAANLAAGRPSPQDWHQRALALAADGRMVPQAIALGRALVTAYPSPITWRDALLVYRELSPADPALSLDIGRLLRASGGLSGERDYIELATTLSDAQLPGEAKAVLDEGVARGMVETAKPAVATLLAAVGRRATADRATLARQRTQALAAATGQPARAAADLHYGFGQYAEAAELYRAALQKGGEDANLVNSRLGASLALAGQAEPARAAFDAVTGPRADLAGFWMAWLARRPAA
jgi:tetratricopeptide (TPR) repeat protein